MAIEKVTVKVVGIAPLLMHNGRMADPTNPYARELKALVKQRNKTDEQLEAARRVEWEGSLYEIEGRPIITADMAHAVAIEGARKSKLGKAAAAGIVPAAEYFLLEYPNPRGGFDALYEKHCDYRGVRVGGTRVMRARPRFDVWSVELAFLVDTDIMEPRQVVDAIAAAGRLVGLGDYRPRFGRFEVQS